MPQTVTTTEIVSDVIESIIINFPMLEKFSHQFTDQGLKKGQTAIAHISRIPDVSEYDAAKGYGGADTTANAKTLYDDVAITVTEHPHVDLSISYINSIADQKHLYEEAINNAAFAIGRDMVQKILGLFVADNFSHSTEVDAIDYDRDTVGGVRKDMNKAGASPMRRIGIVNSDAFEGLDADPRIASRDYYGQQTGGSSLGMLSNVAGFEAIYEYPELPANGELVNGVFVDPRGVSFVTGIPNDIKAIADDLGVPAIANFEIVTGLNGLSLLCIKWMVPGTFDVKITLTLLWGARAGKAGGAAESLTDNAGHITVEAP